MFKYAMQELLIYFLKKISCCGLLEQVIQGQGQQELETRSAVVAQSRSSKFSESCCCCCNGIFAVGFSTAHNGKDSSSSNLFCCCKEFLFATVVVRNVRVKKEGVCACVFLGFGEDVFSGARSRTRGTFWGTSWHFAS